MKLDQKKYELLVASKCLSDVEISKKCGVGRSTITQIKSGTREARPKTLGKIARALGVEAEDIIQK